jgi:hypothetical protein
MLTGPCMATEFQGLPTRYHNDTDDDDDYDDDLIRVVSGQESISNKPSLDSSLSSVTPNQKQTRASKTSDQEPGVLSSSLMRTHEQLTRLKRELKLMKNKKKQKAKASETLNDSVADQGKRRVRFAKKLVSEVHHRPYTREEDIEKLYFIEEELNGYEYDRATTAPEQFEVIAKEGKKAGTAVEVEYKNRRRVSRDDQDDDDSTAPWGYPASMPQQMTPSDLSALRE